MAYESEYELEDELEEELEDEMSGQFEEEMEDEAGLEGEGWLGTIGNIASSLLGESEEEDESEYEDESEEEISPIRKIYPDAMMEHLGQLAAEAESEEEAAEHFLPLIGMAASKLLPVVARAVAPAARRALPRIAKAITRATPHLTQSVGKVAKILHRNPQTRHLLKTVPGIARRTVGHLAKQAAHGRKITPHAAVRTLAHHAKRVLGTPQHRVHALRRHNQLERRLHGPLGRGVARPRHGMHHHRHLSGRVPGHTGTGIGRRYGMRGGTPRTVGGRVHTGVAGGAHRMRAGRMVGGHCQCGSCPTCGVPGSSASPAYCRCCGQVIR